MRILVVTHYFPPEIGAPQARLSELARTWAADGDEVTVLTGLPNHPTGLVPREYRGVRRRVEHIDGYRVIRTWLYATPNEGIVKKTLGHLSFMATSVVLGARTVGPTDVVVVSSPTFFAILSAWFMARRKRARLVVEIRDLWPAIFVELGVLTNPLIIKALETIEMAAYRAADDVVVVSEGFRANLIERGVPAAKIHTIRNGVDLDRFTPESGDPLEVEAARCMLGAGPADALVLYIGAHGISHGLTSIAEAAALLQDQPIHFAFVGEGSAKAELEGRVAQLALTNVTMLPGVPRNQVPGLLSAADICLAPLRDVPLFTTFIPSKIFEYFGAGKAIIGAVRGEPAEILRDGGALVVEPEDAEAIADAIHTLALDPERRARMGESGRAHVSHNFDRVALARQYRDVLASAVDRSTQNPARPTAKLIPDDDVRYRPPGVPASAPQIGYASATSALTKFVWNHPQNASSGVSAQVRAVGRMAAWQLWQHTTGRPLTISLHRNLKLRCYPHSSQASAVLYARYPEWHDMRFVLDYLEPGDNVVDVGANIGVYTLLAASIEGTHVWCYEPSTATSGRLHENLRINGFEQRCTVRRVAVTDHSGTGLFTVGLDTINRMANEHEQIATEKIELVSLDDDLPDDRRIDLLKIDVEGLEPLVLNGARILIERDRPALIIEQNDASGSQPFLEPFGYRPYHYDPLTRALAVTGWHDHVGLNVLALANVEAARRRLATHHAPW